MIGALVAQIEERFAELEKQMGDPAVIGDRQRNAEVGRSYRQLEPAAKLAAEWRHVQDDGTVGGAAHASVGDADHVSHALA